MAIIKEDGIAKRLKALERAVLFNQSQGFKDAYKQGFKDGFSDIFKEVDDKLTALEADINLLKTERGK